MLQSRRRLPEDAAEGTYVLSVVVSGDLEYVLNYTVTVVRGHSVRIRVFEQAVVTTGPYAKFRVSLKNVGTKPETVDLSVVGDLTGRVMEGSCEVKRIVLMPGEERFLDVVVEVPPGEGNYTVVFKAGEEEVTLTVFSKALGKIVYLNEDWRAFAVAGGESVYEVRVSGKGRDLYDLKLTVEAPKGVEVRVEPEVYRVVKAGEEAVFKIYIKPYSSGVFYLTVRAVSANTMGEEKGLRVEVSEPIRWDLVALVAVVAAAIGVLVWKKFKWRKLASLVLVLLFFLQFFRLLHFYRET